MIPPIKLGYLVSHPIQYQTPLLKRLSREPGIDLHVLFCSDLSVGEYQDMEFGQRIQWDIPLLDGYSYEFLPALWKTESFSFFRPFTIGLARKIRTLDFDVLWIHGWGFWNNIWAIYYAKRLGMKVFIRGEAGLHLEYERGWLKTVARNRFLRWLVAHADAFLSIGSQNRAFYVAHGAKPSNIFFMPYAVDNEFFRTRSQGVHDGRESLRETLGLNPGRPIILYASKMTTRKRADDLLEAYIRLSSDGKKEPWPYLLLMGDGEIHGDLERRASALSWNSIKFLGFKNQTELPAFFDLCDVFVLPSVREPWGLVVNEVMNAGKAVIVSDQVGCAQDLVRHKENGYVFSAGNTEDLKEGLEYVLASESRLQEMGKKSLEIISQWGLEQDIHGICQALQIVASTKNEV